MGFLRPGVDRFIGLGRCNEADWNIHRLLLGTTTADIKVVGLYYADMMSELTLASLQSILNSNGADASSLVEATIAKTSVIQQRSCVYISKVSLLIHKPIGRRGDRFLRLSRRHLCATSKDSASLSSQANFVAATLVDFDNCKFVKVYIIYPCRVSHVVVSWLSPPNSMFKT